MMNAQEGHWWIRICLSSIEELQELQQGNEIEIFPQTLRRIDDRTLLVEGYIPKRLFIKLKQNYSLKILGDVDKSIKDASEHVSKTNRYKTQR